ncbi:hypothetical protein ACS0TY_007506 [Phlomoides rotata]
MRLGRNYRDRPWFLGSLMMKGLAIFVSIELCTIVYAADHGVTVSCMMAYEEGGAPAVFNSLECSHWGFSTESTNSTKNCEFATRQGHRQYQEDRVTCNLDLKLPFSGEGPKDITVGIAAIFDGHGGDEASEMASTKIINYFLMHVVFTTYKQALSNNEENPKSLTVERSQRIPEVIDHHSLRLVLEEALLKTIQDIDLEFSKEALRKGYVSGSTGVIVLLFKGQFLVANIGDSKALLCSQKVISHHDDTEGAFLKEAHAEELTRDHHPDREDEKARIEAAGGFITRHDVPRVNGVLALSRAIGDVYLKRYGVTADPEITGWRALAPENLHLVLASDGIFEALTPQNVCDLLHENVSEHLSVRVSASSLSDRIIRRAFVTGSTDNLSAIVISSLDSFTEGTCCNMEKKKSSF